MSKAEVYAANGNRGEERSKILYKRLRSVIPMIREGAMKSEWLIEGEFFSNRKGENITCVL
ncbi:hypothetical protein [Bacillus sp. FJAT-44742]|uniref:hypothetical protein n=1 Tax=Bacillus sp. FJAT-44742 TaxID=2014005 RepID=UPI0018E28D04|nr:hypothetical protein [Bacillus sp. FJAT-44742]